MRTRQRLEVTGVVQGVGFRPFVHRLANNLDLRGFVRNESGLVHIEVEGPVADLDRFGALLRDGLPPLAAIETLGTVTIEPRGDAEFRIAESTDPGGAAEPRQPAHSVPPDVATCMTCLAELLDPVDRRFRHPFITCTDCGPRFTIITSLPYDRPNTTMAAFDLCPTCSAEYHDPTDRRFHAQPVACPDCGPVLCFDGIEGSIHGRADEVIAATQTELARGRVVAVKGLGGYHLACDATDEEAVARLRRSKGRPDKPLAVMVRDLAAARALGDVGPVEANALTSPERPIVLLHRRSPTVLSAAVASASPLVGVMLPSTPLHHLLFEAGPGAPASVPEVLVMTSGNLVDEPICHRNDEARRRLAGIADAFCDHDRPIHVACDDSIVRVIGGVAVLIRRSRGYVPAAIALPFEVGPTLALGGEMKNAVCLAAGSHAWMSQHLGDMDNLETLDAFERSVDQLQSFHQTEPQVLAADAHPGYRTRRWATTHGTGRPVVDVQHHHAHLAALMVEHGQPVDAPLLGFVFDGTGYGDDRSSWGGEVLHADYTHAERLTSLRPVLMPGGDAAARHPCRMALAHLAAADIEWSPDLAPVAACETVEIEVLRRQLGSSAAGTATTSMGRLFDAVASLLDCSHRITFEAQAAMQLEFLALSAPAPAERLVFGLRDGLIDPSPVVRGIVAGVRSGIDPAALALAFHHAVADVIAEVAVATRRTRSVPAVGLTGGCFQNAILVQAATARLVACGFEVLTHRLVPPNDGGIALGQVVVAAARHGGAA
jgi:hydrogenase maturation protein HypF